jgi:hypothetical protein
LVTDVTPPKLTIPSSPRQSNVLDQPSLANQAMLSTTLDTFRMGVIRSPSVPEAGSNTTPARTAAQ